MYRPQGFAGARRDPCPLCGAVRRRGTRCPDGCSRTAAAPAQLLTVFSILLLAAGSGLMRGKGQLGGHCLWPTTRSVRALHTGPGGVLACVQSLAVCAVVFRRPSAVPIAEPYTWERLVGRCVRAVCLVCPVR